MFNTLFNDQFITNDDLRHQFNHLVQLYGRLRNNNLHIEYFKNDFIIFLHAKIHYSQTHITLIPEGNRIKIILSLAQELAERALMEPSIS